MNNLPQEIQEKIEAATNEVVANASRLLSVDNVAKFALAKGAEISLQHMPQWVSVDSDEKPKEGYVLCKLFNGGGDPNIVVLSASDPEGEFRQRFYMGFPAKSYWEDWTEYVTHWMPLPEAPTQR
jgi:hypothetical protein